MSASVRDDAATMTCGCCGGPFRAVGRRRWCSVACRQAAWRARRASVPAPSRVPRTRTVYECGSYGARYLGTQRCEEWADLAPENASLPGYGPPPPGLNVLLSLPPMDGPQDTW
jgi:hypothetical protein